MALDRKRISAAQAFKARRQGLVFLALSAGATGVVLLMLTALLGFVFVRGWPRLFFSPAYELTFTDGSKHRTALGQSVEFDIPSAEGAPVTRTIFQANKHYINAKAEALKYSRAVIPAGTVAEVYRDETQEADDPWASEGTKAEKIRKTVAVLQEKISNAREVSYDYTLGAYSVTLADGSVRKLDPKLTLQFRSESGLADMRTLVTRSLELNPQAAARLRAEKDRMLELEASGEQHVDPAWKAFVTAYQEQHNAAGQTFVQNVRVEELQRVASFRTVEQWNWFQFFWDSPRSGNTEGGVLPCIFGTMMMTLIMTVIVAPFGVAAAVYLREYARNNWFTQMIRLAVANLAGVPSIVFGLFGLGFFVLTAGGSIDHWVYGGEKVFGTPCVLWASLTMALLTLPVMIVASEEALRTVPRELREGALALGATRFSTLTTVVIPAAMPGILTGVILAVARAAGEVAPLLLTGVVAQKDQLPLNPLEKFMNLAYHIYDLSVKAQPNKIEEAQALAFSSALVLVLVVLLMNLLAILLRARLRRNT